jgi:hypothetical protein
VRIIEQRPAVLFLFIDAPVRIRLDNRGLVV